MFATKRVVPVLLLLCFMITTYASDKKERIEKEMRELRTKCPELSYDVKELVDASESMGKGLVLPEKYACFVHCVFKNTNKDGIHLDDHDCFIITDNIPERVRSKLLKCRDGIHETEPCAKAYKFFTECIQAVE